MLPRQNSLPPPNTTACSGWDCLQQSQQFGVIFSIILSVFTFVFLYWFLFWRRRNPLMKQHDDDPDVVEIELRSPSLQTTAVVRFAPGDPGDGRKASRSETVFRLYKEIPQPENELPRYSARSDGRYIPEGSSFSDSSLSEPQRVKDHKRTQPRNKQGLDLSTPEPQSLAHNQAIGQANTRDGACDFCNQHNTIYCQQRMLYMNRLGTNWYNQQPRIHPRLHVMPTAMPGVQLDQVPMVHCYPYRQPYMAPAYATMPANTPAAPMMPSQQPQATYFSQISHGAHVVPIVQPSQPFLGATTAQAEPAKADVRRTTAPRTRNPVPVAQPSVYRDAPWWRSRSSNRPKSPDQNLSARRKPYDYGKDVRPKSRKRGRSPDEKRQEEHSAKLSQKHPEPSSDFNLSDLGSLPSHTTLDSYSSHGSHINGFSRDKILADFERAKLAESNSPRTEVLEPAEVSLSSSDSSVKETLKDSVVEGPQHEPSGKQTADKILITISPPTSSTRSAKTAAGGARGPGDGSEIRSIDGRFARLHPDSASKRVLPGGERGYRKDSSRDGAQEETKQQFLSPKETLLRQDISARTDNRPVLYRVENDGDETASLCTSTQAMASSSGSPENANYDEDASLNSHHRRLASRDREGRNLEGVDTESHENYPKGFHKDSDSASFRPRPPRPFTTEAMSDNEDQSSSGGAGDELAFKNRGSSRHGRGGVDSMVVQTSPPDAIGFCDDELPPPPSLRPGRKKRGGDSSEFFRFRGSDDNVENK
ncbi:hypothetical protein MGG_06463 [Pyricularia oryzae 70-15]|uniref:Uncharacterized protein n=3 Tax=Pyricularia oryzae TaxID=318829 RepID=G4N774_PYRO7|nr:uncharacterized protein MGG_06463 [Pyricularia oryzae 70-15]EHA50784.1 hypothetical protein MGG_06463 [Pyricularia oryzae 70-15]ELQ41898.1 hypothetical protein OOU_Y34scaffold00247g32 [Pyricularia oryzae Y34]